MGGVQRLTDAIAFAFVRASSYQFTLQIAQGSDPKAAYLGYDMYIGVRTQ